MQFVVELWIPILASVAGCFVFSAVCWMALPFHKKEWRRLPTEPDVMEALRREMPAPGRYHFPFTMDGQNRDRADVKAALEKGPIGFLTIAPPGTPSMGKLLGQMIVYYLIVTTLVAYVAWGALHINAPDRAVFRLVTIVSLLAHTAASAPESVWFSRPWGHWIVAFFEGVGFALITGGVFVYFWP